MEDPTRGEFPATLVQFLICSSISTLYPGIDPQPSLALDTNVRIGVLLGVRSS
jgi:hypothetical protein